MKANLLTVFAARNIVNCFDSYDRREFFIDDPKIGPSYIVKYPFHPELTELLFKVEKNDERIVDFLAIDGCLIGRAVRMSRCDFMLFDNSTVCFVEMKMNSDLDDENLSARDTRVKAAGQIIATITFFKEQFLESNSVFFYPTIEGIIAVPDKFPKSNATERLFVDKFLRDNGFPLFIDSKKVFSNPP